MLRFFGRQGRFALAAALAVAVSGFCLRTSAVRALAFSPAADESCRGDDPHGPLKPAALNRLSKAEFSKTIVDLIGADVAGTLPALAGLVAGIPDDDRQAGFANINWTLSADHASAYLGIANEIGTQVGRQAALREKFLPCAPGKESPSDTCIASFIDSFGSRAYRRPLVEAERHNLLGFYEDAAHRSPEMAFGSLITRILLSPNFLFKEEPSPARAAGDCATGLDDDSYRLASRMSFGLWGRMPDAALFAAARRHDLLDEEKLTAEVERMLLDDKAKDWMQMFFREWLHYDHMTVEGYSWPFLDKIDRAHLHEHAAEELDRFIDAIVWTDKGNFYDLMTSRKVITKAPAIRLIYGLPAVQPRVPEQVPPNRSGLLTRVALLAQGHDVASVVKRGAFVRRQLLCDALSPPDPSLLPPGSLIPPVPDQHESTRQRWEARTAPAVCQGCHRRMNSFGFSLEAYDGIGRYRRREQVPILNTTPTVYTTLPIDTAVIPNVDRMTEPIVADPVALSAFIGRSTKGNRCFVRQMTKFVSGHPISSGDNDTLNSLADTMMAPGGSIHDVIVGIVKTVVRQYDAGNQAQLR